MCVCVCVCVLIESIYDILPHLFDSCLSVRVYLSNYLCVCLSVCPLVCVLSVSLSILFHLSVGLSVYSLPSVYLSILFHLSICLFSSICLYLFVISHVLLTANQSINDSTLATPDISLIPLHEEDEEMTEPHDNVNEENVENEVEDLMVQEAISIAHELGRRRRQVTSDAIAGNDGEEDMDIQVTTFDILHTHKPRFS